MNNDTKSGAEVTCQSYYDTDKTKKTYWVHDDTAVAFATINMLKGANHQMYTSDGRLLWDLRECRAGSGSASSATRNYIPWSNTTQPIKSGSAMSVNQVGSVIMRNTLASKVYSPYYVDGIGTVYIDAVNAYAANPVEIIL
jgi:hypothetical protein